jgi:hypothetical protein
LDVAPMLQWSGWDGGKRKFFKEKQQAKRVQPTRQSPARAIHAGFKHGVFLVESPHETNSLWFLQSLEASRGSEAPQSISQTSIKSKRDQSLLQSSR